MEAQGLADLLTALPSTNQPTRQTPHAAFAEREMVAAYDNLSLRFAARIPLPSNELVGNAEVGASATQTAATTVVAPPVATSQRVAPSH